MNKNPIEEPQTFLDRVEKRGIDSYRFAGLKVLGVGIVIMFVGEVLSWDELSTFGIWTFLAAFPVHGVYVIARYVKLFKENSPNRKIDENGNSVAERPRVRGDK
jgi:hypothetical protein